MTGLVSGALDPGRWAWSPQELSRAIAAQLDGPLDVYAAGRTPWVASRWDGPVRLTTAIVGDWVAAWRHEVACRKMI